LQIGVAGEASAAGLKVLSDRTVAGFPFPESVGCDAANKVLYVSQFVSALKPTEKDGKGRISKVSLTGKMLVKDFLPGPGQKINKPKGNWIVGDTLWVTDIDSIWSFDLKTRKGRRVALPGAKFANDLAVTGNAVYVSDNIGDQVFKVEPADFLKMKGEPKVTVVLSGKSINPNGVYPGADGALLMVGYPAPGKLGGIYAMTPGKDPKSLAEGIGRLDGLYQMKNGGLLITDWNSGSLMSWNAKAGVHKLADGFKGPADLCAMPNDKGLLVVVPDLVKSELRFIQLGK
jgi:hypothetical protein